MNDYTLIFVYLYTNLTTYGTSTGKMSATILIESVFDLDVGDAANKIFNNAIMCWGKFGNIAYRKLNTIDNFKFLIQNTLVLKAQLRVVLIYRSNIFLTVCAQQFLNIFLKKGFSHYSNSPEIISGIYKINSQILNIV